MFLYDQKHVYNIDSSILVKATVLYSMPTWMAAFNVFCVLDNTHKINIAFSRGQ